MKQVVLLLPFAVNAALFYAFAHTLLPGRTALLTRFAAFARKQPLDPRSLVYTRWVTAAWAAWFALMALLMATGLLGPVWRDTALTAAALNLPLCVLFLTVEFGLRKLVLRGYKHMSLLGFFRLLVKTDFRALLTETPGRDRVR